MYIILWMYFIKFFFFKSILLFFSRLLSMENSTGKKFVSTRDKFRRGIEEGGGSLFRTEDRETKKLKFSAFQGQAWFTPRVRDQPHRIFRARVLHEFQFPGLVG